MRAMKKKHEKIPKGKKPGKVLLKKTTKGLAAKRSGRRKRENDLRAMFMESLMVKKRELEKTLEHLIDTQKEYVSQLNPGDFIDEFDDAQREISTHSHYSLIERKIRELRKIELRIMRISEDEEFDVCEECGEPIPQERLLIMPEATLCVPCQKRLERLDELKSAFPSAAVAFGAGKGMSWHDSEGYDDESPAIRDSRLASLSVDDLEETETENAP